MGASNIKNKIASIPNFVSKLRWAIMILSFMFFTFGRKIGLLVKLPIKNAYVTEVPFPIFSCLFSPHYGGAGLCGMMPFYIENITKPKMIGGLLISVIIFFILVIPFGRLWCGFVCPFGFIQDVLDMIRRKLHIDSIRCSPKLREKLEVIKWTMIFIFLLGPFIIPVLSKMSFCNICPLKYITPVIAGNTKVLNLNNGGSFAFAQNIIGVIMAAIVLAGSFTKRRFWCSYCPLGLLMGLLHKISFVRLKKDCQSCTRCGLCYDACPMEIKEIYAEREKSDITHSDCIFCMKCIEKCPEDNAIYVTFFGKTIYKASRKAFNCGQGIFSKQKCIKNTINKAKIIQLDIKKNIHGKEQHKENNEIEEEQLNSKRKDI